TRAPRWCLLATVTAGQAAGKSDFPGSARHPQAGTRLALARRRQGRRTCSPGSPRPPAGRCTGNPNGASKMLALPGRSPCWWRSCQFVDRIEIQVRPSSRGNPAGGSADDKFRLQKGMLGRPIGLTELADQEAGDGGADRVVILAESGERRLRVLGYQGVVKGDEREIVRHALPQPAKSAQGGGGQEIGAGDDRGGRLRQGQHAGQRGIEVGADRQILHDQGIVTGDGGGEEGILVALEAEMRKRVVTGGAQEGDPPVTEGKQMLDREADPGGPIDIHPTVVVVAEGAAKGDEGGGASPEKGQPGITDPNVAEDYPIHPAGPDQT